MINETQPSAKALKTQRDNLRLCIPYVLNQIASHVIRLPKQEDYIEVCHLGRLARAMVMVQPDESLRTVVAMLKLIACGRLSIEYVCCDGSLIINNMSVTYAQEG